MMRAPFIASRVLTVLVVLVTGACVSSGGGAAAAPTVTPGPVLPWPEASRNLADALRRVSSGPTPGFITTETSPLAQIRVRPDHFSLLDRGVIQKASSNTGKAEPYSLRRTFSYNSLGDAKPRRFGRWAFVNVWGTEVPTVKGGWGRQRSLIFSDAADADIFVRALNDVIRSAPYAGAADDAFAQQAAAFRAANPKPPLSEAGNRHRVLAEAATREKNFDEAVEHFEAALATDPTWSSGNFNLALVYEALEDWDEAARYMKRFLLLEPDSREANGARDKLIVWEDRARRENRR